MRTDCCAGTHDVWAGEPAYIHETGCTYGAWLVDKTEKLYGREGDEHLHFEIEDAIEQAWDQGDDPDEGKPIIICEWTTHPASHHLPTAEVLLDWVAEWTSENGEVDEYGSDAWVNASTLPDVKEAAEKLLEVFGSKVTYKMADKQVATWTFPAGTHDAPPETEQGIRVVAPDK